MPGDLAAQRAEIGRLRSLSERAGLADGVPAYDVVWGFLVPLAIPLDAGPSAMAVVMLLATNDPTRMTEWLLALLAAWLLSSLILVSATGLKRFLGRRGLIAMERLMGMVLVAVAVQMLLEGIAAYLQPAAG